MRSGGRPPRDFLLPTPMAADASRGSQTYMRGNPTLKGAAAMWPTPTKSDGTGGPGSAGRDGGENLRTAVARVPTPTAGDAKASRDLTSGRSNPDSQHHSGMTLTDFVTLWPTPKATDADRGGRGDLIQAVRGNESPSGHFKTPTSEPFSHGGSGGELHKQVAPSGGPLNPPWVAWLMGFPIDWTNLPLSATPSSPKSRSGSDGES